MGATTSAAGSLFLLTVKILLIDSSFNNNLYLLCGLFICFHFLTDESIVFSFVILSDYKYTV